ncbi:hypothetical protein [Actinoplanes sp. NPDC049316]|uniref:hypothetical protein n=1 Tax=Actinoplanes sp. NPDC049316 TaxID=3154727 RepID=UPI003441DC46
MVLARATVAAVVAGGLVVPFGPDSAALAAAQATEMQRDRVRWRAVSDPRWEVRSAGAAALTSTRGDAITDFLATGLNAALRRAATDEQTNIIEIKYALATSTSTSAVHRAADRALAATHDEKDEFVRHGLAEARLLDAQGDQQHHGEVAKQAQEDRDYIAELARTDPGAQVRSAAGYAANSGRDEDVAEFFAYYWAAGARLDDEAYRLRLADLDAKGNAAMERLHTAALNAQAAERAASGEAAAKLHAETVAAWNALATAEDGTSVNWAAERDRAATQAEAWGRVAEHARGATTEQDWAGVIARAGASRDAWTAAAQQATKQAAYWLSLADEARGNATGSGQ